MSTSERSAVRLVAIDALGDSQVTVVEKTPHGALAVGMSGGKPFAVSNRCRHLFAALGNGHVTDDGCLQCPWHAALYDVGTGKMVRGPQGAFQTAGRGRQGDGRCPPVEEVPGRVPRRRNLAPRLTLGVRVGSATKGGTMARCEWCKNDTDYDQLRPIHDWEEALTGPEHWVCPECVEKERERGLRRGVGGSGRPTCSSATPLPRARRPRRWVPAAAQAYGRRSPGRRTRRAGPRRTPRHRG